MELGWEALEDAGILPREVPDAGAFVDRGSTAERLAAVLGLDGPRLTDEDADCPPLVAVHLACESLRRGEASVALAGGVQPCAGRAGAASSADGFVEGEVGGCVILKPLSLAVADGDRVYGAIRGSATGEDGPTVLSDACRCAAVAPSDIQRVELQDRATAEVGGAEEILGLVAAVSSMGGETPAAPDFTRWLSGLDLEELRGGDGHPPEDRPAVACVSTPAGGAASCVVLAEVAAKREAAPPEAAEPTFGGPFPLVLSAASESALAQSAERLAAHLERRLDLDPADVGYTLATGRTSFRHRVAVLAGDREAVLDALAAVAERRDAPGAVRGIADGDRQPVFVFGGTGGQHREMARELLDASPTFARHVDDCEQALEPFVDWSLRQVLTDPSGAWLEHLDILQPAVLMTTIALAKLYRSCGVQPAALVGQCQGEIAAAHIAGGLSLDDAARVGALYSKACLSLVGKGEMASVSLRPAELGQRLDALGGELEVAEAIGPASTVVAGEPAAVDELLRTCNEDGVWAQRVAIGYACHCSQIEGIKEELLEAFDPVSPRTGQIPFYSTVTGEEVDTATLDAAYWYRNLRQAVLFEPAVEALIDAGHRTFMEIGPHPLLRFGMQEVAESAAGREDVKVLSTLRRGEGGPARFVRSLAEAHAAGVELEWSALYPGACKRVPLPTYPFQRRGRMLRSPDAAGGLPQPTARFVDVVRDAVADVLGSESGQSIESDRAFRELGFDSAAAVELAGRLQIASGMRIPATAVFNNPTITQLAAFMDRRAEDGEGAQGVAVNAHAAVDEPIAILGMACRYPGGADSPERLWELVMAGEDAISPFPGDRGWDLAQLDGDDPARAAAGFVREGGFVENAGAFDADFFGIGPREALAMDPQQRLLLEAAWEALEGAGIAPTSLHGKATGVFAGISHQDYSPGLRATQPELQGYRMTGAFGSVLSGRIAYSLGLEGPAMTVDTACSSSLVTVHLAAQALRAGECSLALAGGVTMLATPGIFAEFSVQGGLAPDGRCKPFAEAADGVAWAEGSGMLVLQRLSDAERAGNPILAVIRGSAVNQDGASNGLTAPNGRSQERVIRQALANAGLQPGDIDAVEAHGTGTTLGDPIEAGALLAAYGQGRDEPLRIGSIKSNIGHTQAAAGVAGVIKMTMAMREGVLPKTLHVDAPSTKVEWEAGAVELLTEEVPWERNGRPRRAGISSFGISGTNAHVILEEFSPAPAGRPSEEPDASSPLAAPALLPLSAKSPEALKASATRLLSHLAQHRAARPEDLAYSLATTRSSFTHRAVLSTSDREQLADALAALSAGESHPALVKGRAGAAHSPVFCFAGQGPQHRRMAYGLLAASAPFRETIEECEAALSPHVDWSLQEVLADGQGEWLERLDVVQPALFAVMVALARLWQRCGIRPAAVLGHSQGEIAAAHIAGALSLDDAATVVVRRAQAMTQLAGEGTMAAVSLSAEDLKDRLGPYASRLSLAAINGPVAQVVSGEVEAIEELVAGCEAEGIRAQRIAVDYAAHSPQIEGLRESLLEAFAAVEPMPTAVPLYSTVTGERIDGENLDAEYWYRNLRETVLFEPVLRSLIGEGKRAFVEISPHPVLAFGIEESAAALLDGEPFVCCESLRRDEDAASRFSLSLAAAHAGGVELDWEALFAGSDAKRITLPTYPFQRERFWLGVGAGSADLAAAGLAADSHPLVGATLASPRGEGLTLTGRISLSSHPWLADHRVAGTVLLPGTAFLELALAAAERCGAFGVAELTLQAPLILAEQGAASMQVTVSDPDEDGRRQLTIYSRVDIAGADDRADWVANASGVLAASPQSLPESPLSWPPTGARELETDFLYDRLAEQGFDYGPTFQGLTGAWQGADSDEVFLEVALDAGQRDSASRYSAHPALLDAALHGIAYLSGATPSLWLPFSWRGVSLAGGGASALRVRLARAADGGVGLELWDGDGAPVGRVEGLALREITPGQLASDSSRANPLFELAWQQAELPDGGAEGSPMELGERTPAQVGQMEDPPEAMLWRHRAHGGCEAAAEAAREGAERALELIKSWLAEGSLGQTRLLFLTERSVAAAPDESPELAGSALWGLVRSAQSEHPGRFGLIDTDGTEDSERALAAAARSPEPQLALRKGTALRPRVHPVGNSGGRLLSPAGPWRLAASAQGTVESLRLVPCPEAAAELAAGEVRVAVHAVGLNFRDVLIALGLYPGAAELGSEGAGVVVEVGEAVSSLAPGDRVMGMIFGSPGPLARADARLLARIPDEWSFNQAAAIPTVYLTALHGLFDLGELKQGERVLIHAGAGGVGMAAIQLAMRAGAEVFATASPAKWGAVEGLGVDRARIGSSRDLGFREKFAAETGEDGFDLVLNSLAGEFVDASLDLLAEGGRLIEMGKVDLRDPERIGESHPGRAYRAFDLTKIDLDRLGELLAEVRELFVKGELRHSPLESWDIRHAPDAFRHLREGNNVGKVTLEIPQRLDPEKTVLVTGGTGALGALVARHLVEEHGARHLLLVSRSGAAAKGAADVEAGLGELGANASIEACDVSDRAELERLLASIDPDHPLGVVVHAAGVLADATVAAMEAGQLEAVFAAKAEAAFHLHELTKQAPLDAFVCFSSIAGAVGTLGQGNYAAANVFLDALAARRSAEGRPANSISWGLWATQSGLTRDLAGSDLSRLARTGVQPISDQQGLELFDAALRSADPHCLAIRVDRVELAAQASAGALPAVFADLVRTPTRRASKGLLGEKLFGLAEAEQHDHVYELVSSEAAAVLGHGSAERIDGTRAFKELGFDSLAAVELRNRLEQATALSLPATAVFDHPTPVALAEHLLSEVLAREPARRRPPAPTPSEEPIAIVGMACRYPGGVDSPEALWRLAVEGGDGIAEFPADRGWDLESLYHPDPDNPGTSYAREGGFLEDAAGFDAKFFGIAPREALAMDPQQRLLLETCWEALEAAGIDPASLSRTPTGVFAGVSSQDYSAATRSAREAEGYKLTGAITSVASGRVAYALGLEGPAITVDTACSSSLVAIHLASQALRGGECEAALAGGVTVLATPEIFTEFSRQRGLAPDGRCKAFADAADGTGFSEGVGVLVLQRLADAERDGHPILAVLRGSAVNQDGASNGLTAPNGPSQQRVIRQALANAGLRPEDIDAVEAHGTGTTLGDPIEAGALLATYGQERESGPLLLGSIKSNIGHTQAAAGVAGVIKMTMALREGLLPKTLHVDSPSSKVDWGAGEIELLTEERLWERNGHPRRAGVSSFGISGTNAHLILEEAAPRQEREVGRTPLAGPLPVVLSARTEPALTEVARRVRDRLLEDPELDPADLAYSLATTRSAFGQRAVAIGNDGEELLAALGALSAGEPAPNLLRAEAREGKLAYLFSGQGSQRPGMGRELCEADPIFAGAFAAVSEHLDAELAHPLTEVLFATGPEAAERLSHTGYAQPALFALEVGLFRTLEARGLRPDLLAGHSIGELAAAHLAGVFSLSDAARLVGARARLMGELPAGGAMLALGIAEPEAVAWIDGKEEQIAIAAINSPSSCVLSGAAAAIEQAEAHFRAEGRKTRRLAVSHAFHSPLMEPMLEQFAEVAEALEYRRPNIPIVSNLTGELLTAERATDPAYWVAHVRGAVRFADAVATLASHGARVFVELGPDPVLLGMAGEALGQEAEVASIATLREGRSEPRSLTVALGAAHAAGAPVDWEAYYANAGARRVPLPTYPFQHERFWLDSPAERGDVGSAGLTDPEHPLLGAAIEDPSSGALTLSGRISLATHPWLADHAVFETPILPGTAFLELALAAAARAGCEAVEELILQAPLALPESGAVALQVSVSPPDEEGGCAVSIHSRPHGGGGEESEEWTAHASGTLSAQPFEPPERLESWPPPGGEPLDVELVYDRLAEHGLAYGAAFQGLTAAWRRGEDLYAEVSLAEEQAKDAGAFGLHPALLDSALHVSAYGALGRPGTPNHQGVDLPFSWEKASLRTVGADSLRVALRSGAEAMRLSLYDAEGAPVGSVGSLRTRLASPGHLRSARPRTAALYEVAWKEVELPSNRPSLRLATLTDMQLPGAERYGDLRALIEALAAGARAPDVVLAGPPELVAPDGAVARAAVGDTLALLQQWLSSEGLAGARLALLTRNGVGVCDAEAPDPAAASLWGLLRSARLEHPGSFVLVDIDDSEESVAALPAALSQGEETELALRGGVGLAPRLVGAAERNRLLPPAGPWRLDATRRGTLESLSLISAPEILAPLGSEEVRIAVRAAGLNFRDVLIALGVYPGEAPIGSEGAGVVLEVGAGVSDLSPGDEVMGIVPGAFGSVAVADRRMVAAIPAGWSFEQAAAVPIAFLTAWYGLLDLARLEAGEKVLVHAGAGGVGMAAVQLARHRGAEVFATASPSKWDALRELGLDDDHIASSRDLSFRAGFLGVTGGEGVDVVLNSLAREFVDASLELLPRGGRFVEMGKADIRDPERVLARHAGVSYQAFDLFEAGPERIAEMLAGALELFADGDLRHLPTAVSSLSAAPEAFRNLREGRNLGKAVLTVPRPFDCDRTVLVTGGTGGLGALVARHLAAEHGARRLLLVSRSGPAAVGAAELEAELTGLGAEVTIAACDVSERGDLQRLLSEVPEERPLGAVVHVAGAVHDATVESLDEDHLRRAFGAKAEGAWHLHELTEHSELSAFITFSSVAGTLGAPGQGNYAAANAFLDALALKRRGDGLPATSIAWGPWDASSGMTSRLGDADLKRMGRAGMAPLSAEHGLGLFDAAVGGGLPSSVAMEVDRQGLLSMARAGTLPPIQVDMVSAPRRRVGAKSTLQARIAALPEEEAARLVLDLVRSEAAAVLGHGSANGIPEGAAFKEVGFDSLAAVELRNRLGAAAGLRLPATVVFDHPSPAQLAAFLHREFGGSAGPERAVVRAHIAANEPIAIVGMACRYPGGAESPARLWELVAAGEDAIAPFPTDRGWDLERLYHPDPDAPGTSYVREGGFLVDPGQFDPGFFGIARREALAMDPQQRLLLESSWEALEEAAIDPTSLSGQTTGVFAGVVTHGYATGAAAAPEELEGYLAAGTTASVISGRVAYALGLEGPAMTVDTACSSSLVAVHLASQALRAGECSLALAGGVTVLATPMIFTEFSRQRGLADDGRCKAFAEAADGTGFSEGVGMLVLQRLSDAQREGHPILAVIRGSAVNQDGASNGLTAPNGPSQERVIRQALANAGLRPEDVDAVEAHGTGTALGDPIEAQALLATYGAERESGPLLLGSIKSNIGHTQAAAGVAGLIKMTMAMREGVLPRTLHVDAPSSKVDWDAGAVELLTEERPWERNGRPRRAGISSFGISGTNAHLILEEAPEPAPAGSGEEPAARLPLGGSIPLLLSAKTERALRAAATDLGRHLSNDPDLALADVGHSLARRASFEHRAVAIGRDRDELMRALGALSRGEEAAGLVQRVATSTRRPALLFPGQGAQWEGMALELAEASRSFSARIAACEEALEPFVDWSLTGVLRERPATWLERLDIVQPALFAVMVSLGRLWCELGLEPSTVVGHSQGEVAAAHLAGGLDLNDAARIIALRAQAMAGIAGRGGMLSVSLPVEELLARVEPFGERVSLAAMNGPASQVLSGDPPALEEILAACERDGVRAQRIAVDYAAHSAQIDALRDELLEAFAPISPRSGDLPFHSTVTGEAIDTALLDAEYWYRNLRQTVRLEPVVRSLLAQGERIFLEVSPHPVLGFGLQETVDASSDGASAAVLDTLRRREGGSERFSLSMAAAHVAGAKLDWAAVLGDRPSRQVPLPTYPFQRERFWLASSAGAGDVGAAGLADPGHPLLGAAIEDPVGDGLTLTGRLSLATHPWLADHAVFDTPILPGTAFLELALAAGAKVDCGTVEELTLQAPMALSESGALQVQVSVSSPNREGAREVSIHSRSAGGDDELIGEARWTTHATGTLSPHAPPPAKALQAWPPPGAEPLKVEFLYDRLAGHGFDYGPAFQGLTAAWRHGEDIYVEASLAEEQAEAAKRFILHPALLDSAFHAGLDLALGADGKEGSELLLPFAWQGVRAVSTGATAIRARIALEREAFGLTAVDPSGDPVASVSLLAMRPLERGQLRVARSQDSIYRVEWLEPSPPPPATSEDARLFLLGGPEAAGVEAEHCPDIDTLLEAVGEMDGAPATVLACIDSRSFLSDSGGEVAAATSAATQHVLDLTQQWLGAEALQAARLVILTNRAVAHGGDEQPDLIAAPAWGLLRTAQSEHPGRFALIDTDGEAASRAALPSAIEASLSEPQLALREGRMYLPRLVASREAGQGPAVDPIEPGRTVLITGGTGGLGSLLARHLVESHGARHLLLVSRAGKEAQGAAQLALDLSELGAEVTIAACDVAEREQLKALLDEIPAAHPLGAVVHLAGVLDDGVIESLDPARLRKVMRPKVDAAWHLHELTAEADLSQFVMFSSSAGLLGHPSQASYAAANTFLDALAAFRCARGLPATSLAWGLWEREGGMVDGISESAKARLRRNGISPLSDEEGLDFFDTARSAAAPLLAPVRFERAALRDRAEAEALPPILRLLVRASGRHPGETQTLISRLDGVPADERERVVLDLVRTRVATVLGEGSADSIEPGRAFQEMGFDSLAAAELRNRLGADAGMRLPATLVFDYPTPAAIAGYLVAELSLPEDGANGGSKEAHFREALARIPLSRLREAGVMGTLQELVDGNGDSLESADAVGRIRDMDIEELVEQTLARQLDDIEPEGAK